MEHIRFYFILLIIQYIFIPSSYMSARCKFASTENVLHCSPIFVTLKKPGLEAGEATFVELFCLKFRKRLVFAYFCAFLNIFKQNQ